MSSIKELKADQIKFKKDLARYVEITNLLGHKLHESGRYEEAVAEHWNAISVCTGNRIKNQTINCKLEAVSRRALGECYSEMGKHREALEQHKIYQSLALQLNDPIEVQRAHATIGRTYLLWGQESDDKTNRDQLSKAKNSFQKALDLCENLKFLGKLKPKEYVEMKSRLLLNLGLVYENLQDFNKCKELIQDSIVLTKANFLLDELFRCQISMGSINEKIGSYREAVYQYEEAMKTAETLKSKRKKFDVLICLGLVSLKQQEREQNVMVDKAKSYLKKAYFLKIQVEEDQERIKELLKVTLAIEDDLRKLSKLGIDGDLEEKIILCDRLGDHFVVIKCFNMAIKFYQKELHLATEANKPDSFISNIYVSIGQTYFDDGKYREAIEHFKHEFNFQLGNPIEQCTSLVKIADIQECLLAMLDRNLDQEESGKLEKEILENYEQSLKLLNFDDPVEYPISDTETGNRADKLRLYQTVVKSYLNFLKAHNLNKSRQEELKRKHSTINDLISDLDENVESSRGNKEVAEDVEISTDVYDQYSLDLLSNPSDSDGCGGEDDEETPENFHSRPKRMLTNKSYYKSRLNQFGETPLHTACISGNFAQVERLIEQQQVDINAKDFCGWTALHEAANHGFLAIVEYLLKNGANIEASDDRSDRITPLHDACNCGHFDVINLLLKYNANVLALNKHGETPLECLIGWRERSKTELNKQEISDCLELETKFINLMKEKGFDLANLFNKRKHQPSKFMESSSYSSSQTTISGMANIKKRNLVKDLIYSSENTINSSGGGPKESSHPEQDYYDDSADMARNEYSNTIESLRYFGSSKNNTGRIQSNVSSRSTRQALVNEDEEAPRDDWLIDDLDTRRKNNNNNKQTTRKRNNEEYSYSINNGNYGKTTAVGSGGGGGGGYDCSKKLKSMNPMDSNETIHIIDDDVEDHDEDNDCNDPGILGDRGYSAKNASPIKSVEGSGSIRNIASNYQSRNNTVTKNRKALTINFDDQHKSSFMVFIEKDSDCKWLKEELARRYFTHYGMKPLISLKTDNNAILLDSDPVIDIIDNQTAIKAIIDSWQIDQPDKRYTELCALQKVNADKTIESCLRKSAQTSYLTLSGAHFPCKTQTTLLFKSMLQQGIKELDLSFTDSLIHKENYNAFRAAIVSLPNLEQLNLCGVSFPQHCLIHLINLSFSLRKLDLSFNSLGDESTYSLAQIIITYRKLEHFNLSGCDLGSKFIQSNLLKNSIENSNLSSLLLEHNDLPMDLINKFKSLDINRNLIR